MVPAVADPGGTDSSPSLAARGVFKRDTADWTRTLRSASSLVSTAGDGASEERFTLGSPALIHQGVRRRERRMEGTGGGGMGGVRVGGQ